MIIDRNRIWSFQKGQQRILNRVLSLYTVKLPKGRPVRLACFFILLLLIRAALICSALASISKTVNLNWSSSSCYRYILVTKIVVNNRVCCGTGCFLNIIMATNRFHWISAAENCTIWDETFNPVYKFTGIKSQISQLHIGHPKQITWGTIQFFRCRSIVWCCVEFW